MSEKLITLAKNVSYLKNYYFNDKSVEDLLNDLIKEDNDNSSARADIIIKIITSLWKRHEKDEMADKMEDWCRIEQFLYASKKYRDHLQHQLYVYLLGSIVIEDIFNDAFSEFMDKLLKNTEFYDIKYRTHFVWMMASTFHDYGYPGEKFNTIFDMISNFFRDEYGKNIKIDSKSESNNGHKKMFDDLINNIKCIEDLVEIPHFSEEFLNKHFSKHKNEIDHGIFSGMILIPKIIKIMDPKKVTKADKLLWKTASRTMALHNYRENKISVDKDPLLALLIICDEIQDWDRKNNRNKNDLDFKIENIEKVASGIKLDICIINADTEKFRDIMKKKRFIKDLIIPKKCNKEFVFNVCYTNNVEREPPIDFQFLCKN